MLFRVMKRNPSLHSRWRRPPDEVRRSGWPQPPPPQMLAAMSHLLYSAWNSLIEYETPRLVKIHNRKVGIVRDGEKGGGGGRGRQARQECRKERSTQNLQRVGQQFVGPCFGPRIGPQFWPECQLEKVISKLSYSNSYIVG